MSVCSSNMDTQRETFEPLAVAASRLGVPSRWLKSEAIAERVPVLRVGKRLLFNVEQVERALLEKAEASKSRRSPPHNSPSTRKSVGQR